MQVGNIQGGRDEVQNIQGAMRGAGIFKDEMPMGPGFSR